MTTYLQKIKEGQYTLIIKSGRRVVFRSSRPGILDLAIASRKGLLKQATIYDKTIGLAAAKIAVFSGVKEIFSLLASSLALAFCQERKIPLYAEKIVEKIYDHKKGNECHLEKMAQKTDKISDLISNVISSERKMKFRILGRTNLRVSEIGFGAIPIQRVSFKEAADIINKAHQYGINFIDTARAWTDSELKVGQAIKSHRSEWVIASKSPVLTYKEMKEEIIQSLKNLKTDFIDLYMIHHLKDKKMLDMVLSQNGALKALKESQKEGKIKFIGVSGHNLETLLLVAKTGFFDVLMVNFNFKEQEAAKTLLPFCQKENIGIIVMKPLAGGTFQNAASAMRFCLSNPAVSIVIPGICNERELEEDVVEVLENPSLAKEDEKKLRKEVEKIGLPFCRACGYCITRDGGCPARINITLFLRLEGYFEKFGPKDWLMEVYRKTPVKPASCLFCGHCEKVCPFFLPVIRALRNLKIRKNAEKNWGKEKPSVNAPPRDYDDEYQEFVNLTQKILGPDHDIPLAYFNFPRPANEGQKATVRSLFKEMVARVQPNEERMEEILKKLCREMGIESRGIKSFENLLSLADYNNVVDLMRVLPWIKNN